MATVLKVVEGRPRPRTAGDAGFFVLLGPDYAGKSAAMSRLAGELPGWRFVSVDDAFLPPGHELLGKLKRQLVKEALPVLGRTYSADFAAALMQTAVVHLRDQLTAPSGRGPALVDSYYYKILAKCRLMTAGEHPMFAWWRSFPRPRRVLYLDVPPELAWRRSGSGARANRSEHYGEHPCRASFTAFQADLRRLMLAEVRHLPVSVLAPRRTVGQTAQAIKEVLSGADR